MRVGSRIDSTRVQIEPLLRPALPEVAGFLHRWHPAEDVAAIRRRLAWLLSDSPLGRASAQHGLCIRDDGSGALTGVLLSFPGAFLVGDRRLFGLGSGSFFVEPRARSLGFYLFKRYLNTTDYSFFFSTTCNASSAPLWTSLGACAVGDSSTEYMLPLALDVLLPAFLTRATTNHAAGQLARAVGRGANAVRRRFTRGSTTVTVEPCHDWDKLAELARRHRPPDRITTERSADYLEWRYAPHAHNHPFDLCVFRDAHGHEGWFALGQVVRGRQKQIRGSMLLDAVWPRGTAFREILPAIVERVTGTADALFFQPRAEFDCGRGSRWIIPCRLEAPRAVAVSRRDLVPPIPISALDLVPADGDGAF